MKGFEPHGCPPAPKAGASASSATSAHSPIDSHYSVFEKNCQLWIFFVSLIVVIQEIVTPVSLCDIR